MKHERGQAVPFHDRTKQAPTKKTADGKERADQEDQASIYKAIGQVVNHVRYGSVSIKGKRGDVPGRFPSSFVFVRTVPGSSQMNRASP